MTLSERVAAAKAKMNAVHEAFIQAELAVDALAGLDTPDNVADLDPKTVKAFRRDLINGMGII